LIRLAGTIIFKNFALLFESFHVLTDLMVTAVVFAAIKISSSRFSKRYSYGLYRIEDLVSLFIAVIIAFTAIYLLLSVFSAPPSYSFQSSVIEIISLVPLFLSGIVKIIGGKAVNSPSLASDGYHNYSDVYVGIGVAMGLLLTFVTGSYVFYYAAIIFAATAILYISLKVGKDSVTGIMDLPKDKKVIPRINGIIMGNQEVTEVKSIKARWAGPVIFGEIVLTVNSRLTIEEAHDVSDSLEKKLLKEIPDLRDVVIHIEPSRNPQRVLMVPITENDKIFQQFSKSQRYLIINSSEGRKVNSRIVEIPREDILPEKNAQRLLNIVRENNVTDLLAMNAGEILFSLMSVNHIVIWKAQSESVEDNITLFLENKLAKFEANLST
jgi:cation diffusion facilitator family transporter